jgi:hypothetical protein
MINVTVSVPFGCLFITNPYDQNVPVGCPFSAGSFQLPYAWNGFHRIEISGNSNYSSFTVLGNRRIKETPIFSETNFVSFLLYFLANE